MFHNTTAYRTNTNPTWAGPTSNDVVSIGVLITDGMQFIYIV